MTRHDKLFGEYVAALRERKAAADAWWTALLAAEIRATGSEQDARRLLQKRWPFGPASHPFIIAVYREYFLRCEALNLEIESQRASGGAAPVKHEADESDWGEEDSGADEGEQPVPGWVLLVDMLPGRHDELARFLEGLAFKPIATDPHTAGFL